MKSDNSNYLISKLLLLALFLVSFNAYAVRECLVIELKKRFGKNNLTVKYTDEICTPNRACNVNWGKYDGQKIQVRYENFQGNPRTIDFHQSVNSTERFFNKVSSFDSKGEIKSAIEPMFEETMRTNTKQARWISLEVDEASGLFAIRKSQVSTKIEGTKINTLVEEELEKGLLELTSTPGDTRGFVLVITSNVPNEPITPQEMALIYDHFGQMVQESGMSAEQAASAFQLVKVSPGPDGRSINNSFTFDYNPAQHVQ